MAAAGFFLLRRLELFPKFWYQKELPNKLIVQELSIEPILNSRYNTNAKS